jgi:hypothetical protein
MKGDKMTSQRLNDALAALPRGEYSTYRELKEKIKDAETWKEAAAFLRNSSMGFELRVYLCAELIKVAVQLEGDEKGKVFVDPSRTFLALCESLDEQINRG